MDATLLAERDAICTIGLLAHNYMEFDPGIEIPGWGVTHRVGFNVHCCVVDNVDGELLAIDKNTIHSDDNPLQHAEQRALRGAMDRLHLKRPRPSDMTVEKYYQQMLFMRPGTSEHDMLASGCTMYNTFDPCAMCAVTLLLAYMKRIVYILPDDKYAGLYEDVKAKYFSNRESVKELARIAGAPSRFIGAVHEIARALSAKVEHLKANGVQLIHVLDHCRDELRSSAQLLQTSGVHDLITDNGGSEANARTLREFQISCGFLTS